MRRFNPTTAGILALSLFGTATCTDATDVDLLEVDAFGVLFGVVYLDANGNALLDAADALLPDIRVTLSAGQGTLVDEAETDAQGRFAFPSVAVGAYRVALDPAALGDSLQVADVSNGSLNVTRGDTIQVDFGVAFPVFTVEEIRALEPGKRVTTTGVALNGRVAFGDGRVHIKGASGTIRATEVSRSNLNAGDSVRFQGRTAIDAGQPILTDVTPAVLVGQATLPIPVGTTTHEAATARSGALDAALVRLQAADILDTMTVDGDFRFVIDDGSGPLDVVIQSFLQLNTAPIQPDTIVRVAQVTGLLVPTPVENGFAWRLFPRAGADLLLELKQLDLAVSMTTRDAVVRSADTLSLRVILENRGAIDATEVGLDYSVPPGLATLGVSASRGSYSSATGRWTVGTMPAGAADTLTVRARVTRSSPGTIINTVSLRPLSGQVDGNPSNDSATLPLTVVTQIDADLAVEVSASPTLVHPSDTVEVTVLTINNGPLRATNIRIADTISAGFALLSSSATRGSYSQATGVWTIDTLRQGGVEELRLRMEVTATADTTLFNRATILPLTNEIDTVSSNDSDSVAIEIANQFQADLQVGMTSARSSATPNDTFGITVLVTNNGPHPATSVSVSDTIPNGLTLVGSTATAGSFSASDATWTIDSLAPGANAELVLRVRATGTPGTTVQNRATILPLVDQVDPEPSNDTAFVTVSIVSSQQSLTRRPTRIESVGDLGLRPLPGQAGSASSMRGFTSAAISFASENASSSDPSKGTTILTSASSVRRFKAASRSRSTFTKYSLWATRPRPWYQ